MLDIYDFKAVNDTEGHQPGPQPGGQVLRDTSRDADTPARYGGQEVALVLPHTDLEGSYAIVERIRSAIVDLRIPRLDRKESCESPRALALLPRRRAKRPH